MKEIQRKLCLLNEIEASINFIKSGLGDLQKIKNTDNFYDAPILSLSFGLEKMLKCLILIKHWNNPVELKKLHHKEWTGKKGHNLKFLLDEIIDFCEKENYSSKFPAAKQDIAFITRNDELKDLILVLSDFAQGGRFYNLDVIMLGYTEEKINPSDGWQKIESSILDRRIDLKERILKEPIKADIGSEITKEIICILERFLRSISRLFTLADFGNLAKQVSPKVFDFLFLKDEDIGKKNYC
ncbi:hypothetical protein ASZ90_016377 [hydrocarbon metagenome]|uniref:Uncharacterized protein n=1 Tax=hydrocarbon metagenome TaxID=938273 RepID=A0A0W8EXU2_9ZZZZ